ncbi:MAG: PAS domain-containing protein [Sphingobacteriales bacterium]|nr:MAG: PAS domain-containing protein [Sphingobacteriales bacterium]
MKTKISQFYGINQVNEPSDLFNTFTDTFYFAKDRAGRFVYANQLLYEHFDLNDPADVIGHTDYDFFRRDIADQMHADDLQVMREGITISNKLELIQDGTGEVHWFITTKMPLRDRNGEIVGVEGLSRDARRSKVSIEPYSAFKNCIPSPVLSITIGPSKNFEAYISCALANTSVNETKCK